MEKMEKSEKHRFSMKPELSPTEKSKKRRSSKMPESPQTQENQMRNPNIMLQGEVPVMQGQQFYGMPQQQMMMPQQQMMMAPYGQGVMMNTIPGQSYNPNPYVINQIQPVPVTPLKFGYVSREIVCPYCQSTTLTKVEESFNCCTCFVYIIIILLIPILLVLAAYAGCNNVHCNNGCDCDCRCNCCCYGETCDCKCCIDRPFRHRIIPRGQQDDRACHRKGRQDYNPRLRGTQLYQQFRPAHFPHHPQGFPGEGWKSDCQRNERYDPERLYDDRIPQSLRGTIASGSSRDAATPMPQINSPVRIPKPTSGR